MKKFAHLTLMMALACILAGCTAMAETREGQAQGYGGTLKVRVTMEGDKLGKVEVTEHHETQDIGTRAIDQLPEKMASAGTWQVDGVSGATMTSEAMKQAVRMALGESEPSSSPQTTDAPKPEAVKSGTGMAATGRVGPGKDETGAPVYSFNVVFACASFDEAGRITALQVDQLEVATPNYDGETMPKFSGFPGQGDVTEDDFLEQVAAWQTKRDRGEDYQLASGTWAQQMDAFQQLFMGKTVEEAEGWFSKFCSDETGRPLKADSENEGDQAKYAALTDEEKQQLTDATSSATMSLRDGHGDILAAIRRAWKNAQ